MATLTYNGITLPFVNITQFEQLTVADDLGQTDWYVTQFNITCHAVVNANYFQVRVGGDANPVQNPAAIMTIVRSLLLKRRKKLSVQFNGVELVPQAQAGLAGSVDAKNGPIPQDCNIIQLTNTTFLVTYRLMASYWENNAVSSFGGTNQQGGDVLYNRWTDTVDIDANNFSTRTRDGQFRIRSDNASGKIADMLRTQMAVIGIPPGFLRDSAHYQISPDGLTLKFRVVDKEVFKKPPVPAFKADGYFNRTTPVYGNPWSTALCHVRLEASKIVIPYASPSALQAKLMSVAAVVAYQKLGTLGAPASGLITQAQVRAGLYSNWVEATFSAKWAPGKTGSPVGPAGGTSWLLANPIFWGYWLGKYTGMRLAELFITPTNKQAPPPPPTTEPAVQAEWADTPISDDGSGPDYVPNYLMRGTAGLLLETAAYYDPSILSNLPVTTNINTAGDNPGYPIGNRTQLQTGAGIGTAGKIPE